MSRLYRDKPVAQSNLLGMLYVVDVKMVNRKTKERVRHKLLIVGCEAADIERKVKWIFDASEFAGIEVTKTEKVREKVHFIHTVVTQNDAPAVAPVIKRDEGSAFAPPVTRIIQDEKPRLWAIGVTTQMLGVDATHALRKLGHALISRCTPGKSHAGATLSDDSTISIEEIPFASGYAMPRDVSNEANEAHFVRG